MAPSINIPAQGGMFHTFQGVTPRKASIDSQDSVKTSRTPASKRITTPHACAECKRRKIRCDGQQPCGQCLSSRAPKRCFYDKHRQRVIPSRKTLEALSESLEDCRSVLRCLFPEHEPQALLPLSREELLTLLDRPMVDTTIAAGLPSPPLNTSPMPEMDVPLVPKHEMVLEQMPARGTAWDEERQSRDDHAAEVDDMNAFPLSVDRHSSYLGASSIKAALMVMLKLHPGLRSSLSTPLNNVDLANNYPVVRSKSDSKSCPQRVPWSWKGQTLIDAYFKRVHVFVPMLDETSFRADYLEGQRFDAAWLSLLNMVFAMGSVAAMKSDDYNHVNYYNKAMEHLSLDALGSSHIETVQALALIGGPYLHYINRPNMANAVIGAAMRMASAMGLHRESHNTHSAGGSLAATETRRRTWWSLFCLDTWATTTLGRPSFGRWGPAINVRPPDVGGCDMTQQQHHSQAGILALAENIKFCKIATQVQDVLAVTPLLGADERCRLDARLVGWHESLPWPLRGDAEQPPCAEPLYLVRCVMRWRYLNLRMLLHRPVLLSLAAAGVNPATHASPADAAAVETCRALAARTVHDVAREWSRNQMSGWNAAWFLYQAAVVPLVSAFWQWGEPRVGEWLALVEEVIELLVAMEEWSLAARRIREVVWRMYESARSVVQTHAEAEAHRRERRQSQAAAAAAAVAAAAAASASVVSPAASCESSIRVITSSTDAVMLDGADADIHMSPIDLDPAEGLGIMGMLDQQGLWDMDASCWAGEPDELAASAGAAGPYGDPAGMLAMDYGLMNHAAALDGYAYV